ncbi:MAG TPA: 4Fe-4S dicluster-binding protein [bacterium]|nr:4Fe-4S dicluster-binding protein [bacterium]
MAEVTENKTENAPAADPNAWVPNFTLPKDAEGRSVLVASSPPESEYKKVKLKKKPKTVAVVDEDSCVGCEYCVHVCPIPNCLALVSVEGRSPQIETTCVVNEDTCIACRNCEEACPYDAIHVVKREEIDLWKHSVNLPKMAVGEE